MIKPIEKGRTNNHCVLLNNVIYRQPLLYKLVCQEGVGGDVHTPVVVSEAVGQLHVAAEAVRVPANHVSE